MKKIALSLFILAGLFTSCSSDDDNNNGDDTVIAPATYSFTRNGNSTVSFSGQTTRIAMSEELVSGLKDNTKSQAELNAMYAHEEGANDFENPDLNASGKNARSKTAASTDFYSSNTTDSNAIKADFDGWIEAQVTDVFPNWNNNATPGNAGQIQEGGGGSIRYVNEKGLEYNQAFAKSLIGGLMTDQLLNNYLSPAVLDAGDNRTNNDNNVLEDGKDYTTMEHKWDEAYGYLYGAEENPETPVLGADSFLNKYLSRVEDDPDFAGIADDIYNAFKLGRAAIVAKNYLVRDQQADIIKEKVSLIIAVRAVYYLQAGKDGLAGDWASAFHDLSEGYGFVYSLQFTRVPNESYPYFNKNQVDSMIAQLMEGNGFWDLDANTLELMSEVISDRFDFKIGEAAN